MGQYYLICNLDKKEYLHPHRFDEGMKAREWMWSGRVPRALSILLIDGDGRGGGDVRLQNTDIIGRWAGDRIVISGDYSDEGKFLQGNSEEELLEPNAAGAQNVFAYAGDNYNDISEMVIGAINELPEQLTDGGKGKYTYKPRFG